MSNYFDHVLCVLAAFNRVKLGRHYRCLRAVSTARGRPMDTGVKKMTPVSLNTARGNGLCIPSLINNGDYYDKLLLPQMIATVSTTKYTIENDLTKKEKKTKKKKKQKTNTQTNGMYLSKAD